MRTVLLKVPDYRDFFLQLIRERREQLRINREDPEDMRLLRAIRTCPSHYGDITITDTNVVLADGTPVHGLLAAETLAAGSWLYKPTSSTLGKTDCDASTTDSAKSVTVGMALNSALIIGAPVSYAKEGNRVDIGSVVAQGVPYVLSGTAGKMQLVSDLATDDWVTIAAVGVDANTIEVVAKALLIKFG